MSAPDPALRHPRVADAARVWEGVRSSPLDDNSPYAYAAVFRDFPSCCALAEVHDELAGFVVGWRPAERPDVLFVWQIGVHPSHRGRGIAGKLLRWLAEASGARWIEATVTPDNTASRALFASVARDLRAGCEVTGCFSTADLGGDHLPEDLFRIGPVDPSISGRSA